MQSYLQREKNVAVMLVYFRSHNVQSKSCETTKTACKSARPDTRPAVKVQLQSIGDVLCYSISRSLRHSAQSRGWVVGKPSSTSGDATLDVGKCFVQPAPRRAAKQVKARRKRSKEA